MRIRPAAASWRGPGIRELWGYREVLYFLSKRELQVRYNQSLVGIGWAIAQPLALAAIFSLVFGRFFDVPSQGVPYSLFVLVGFTAWLFVAQTVTNGAGSLVADASLLNKVYFPRTILPLAKAVSMLVDFAIALVVVVAVATAFGYPPGIEILTLPGWLLLLALPATGIAMWAGALNVRYRDVGAVLPLLVQLWLFLTPVTYPETVVSENWRFLFALNPVADATTGLRWALIGTAPPDPLRLVVSITLAVVITAVAVVYFRRSEQTFADVV